MALTVAPADGYDSLVSLTAANLYCTAMGHAAWTGDDDAKEVALRRATQYLLGHYRIRDEYLDPVHSRVEDACCEAAVRALTGELYTDVAASEAVEKTVGPITVKYATGRNGGQTRFALIDDLLRGLVVGAGALKVVRA